MFAIDVHQLSELEQQQLATVIRTYSDIAVVSEHHLDNGAHGVADGDGIKFFEWHRRYLIRLEDFLRQSGWMASETATSNTSPSNWGANRGFRNPLSGTIGIARGRFESRIVPATTPLPNRPLLLPYWKPWTPIPEPLRHHNETLFGVWAPARTPTEVTEDWFDMWSNHNLAAWPDADKMGIMMSWGPHFWVHFHVGGVMRQLHLAPAAPIFWLWHAFIDNIYSEYQARGYNRKKTITVPDFKYPSWAPPRPQQPPPPPPLPGSAETTTVPFCIGSTLRRAKDLLQESQLQLGETYYFDTEMWVVAWQWPLPGVIVERGSQVMLSSVECAPNC
jgi:hypothetical protein